MHLKSLANEISMTAWLVFVVVATMAWLICAVPANATSVHVLSSTLAPLSSGSGIASSVSSSSCASASKCDTMKWPEWIISFSCLSHLDALFRRTVDVGVGGDGADTDVSQLSRSSCCWCDTPCAILLKYFIHVFSTSPESLIKSISDGRNERTEKRYFSVGIFGATNHKVSSILLIRAHN